VQKKTPATGKPRVYTAFGHPLFPVYATKPINELVEIAGGVSINREENFTESKNAEYTVEELNRLDPEVILVSGMFNPTDSDFTATCRDLGVHCRALDTGRVYILNGRSRGRYRQLGTWSHGCGKLPPSGPFPLLP